MWLNPTWDSNWRPIITKRQAYNVKNDWGLWKDNSGNDFMFMYGNNVQASFTTDTTDVPSGQWSEHNNCQSSQQAATSEAAQARARIASLGVSHQSKNWLLNKCS